MPSVRAVVSEGCTVTIWLWTALGVTWVALIWAVLWINQHLSDLWQSHLTLQKAQIKSNQNLIVETRQITALLERVSAIEDLSDG